MWDFIFKHLSHDLAIDLGTANTLVLISGKGVVLREPSVVAMHQKTKKIIAIGSEAKKMLGKTPQNIIAFRPLKDGVISDFDATAALLKYCVELVHERHRGRIPKVPRPKVVIGIPSGVTEVERRAVADAVITAGARACYLVEEPLAAAVGANLPIEESRGSMIVDIGGGTTEIAVLSMGGVVCKRSIKIAGDEMDEAIVSFFRLKYSLLIGLPTAENIKIEIGSAFVLPSGKKGLQMVVRGRDLETGLPKSVRISEAEIREVLSNVVNQIIEGISAIIEATPPELLPDILEQGMALAGGGALLRRIDQAIADRTKLPVWIVDDPLSCVVKGCGRLLQDPKHLERVKITDGLL